MANIDTGASDGLLSSRLPSGLGLSAREIEASIAGGLAGAFQAVLVIQLFDLDAIKEIGTVVGVPTLNGGWLTMFGLGVVFALPFAAFVSRSINTFVNKVIMLSQQSTVLQKLLVPLLQRSALAVTTLALGNVYGIAVGVVFHLVVLPVWLTVVMGVPTPIPYLTLAGVVGVAAWALYGGLLGLVYGLVREA